MSLFIFFFKLWRYYGSNGGGENGGRALEHPYGGMKRSYFLGAVARDGVVMGGLCFSFRRPASGVEREMHAGGFSRLLASPQMVRLDRYKSAVPCGIK